MLRLRVVEYFEDLRNALDLHTETKIIQNVAFENYWNERRDKQLAAVNKIEKDSLARADKVLSTCTDSIEESEKLPLLLSQVMTELCFPLEYGGMMFVATVNKYVDEKEVDNLRQFLRLDYSISALNRSHKTANLLYADEISNIYGPTQFETDVFDQIDNILTVDETVIDMSWWFNLDYHFDQVVLSNPQLEPDSGAITCPWKIRRLATTFYTTLDIQAIRLLKIFKQKKIKAIQDIFRQADSIVVTLEFHILTDNQVENQVKANLASALASIEWDQRTTPVVKLGNLRKQCDRTNNLRKQGYEASTEAAGWYKELTIILDDLDWFSQVNWGHMFELSVDLDGFNEQCLSKLDLSSLCALKSLKLYDRNPMTITYIPDWSFLDPVRACLEFLSIRVCSFEHISWRAFRGMVKLERLIYYCVAVRHVEVEAGGHLFADLVRLKSLKIDANESFMATKWFCELPSLESLEILLPGHSAVASAQINFNLPNLKSFVCNCEWIFTSSLDLTRSFSALSHVDKLSAPVDIILKGWFKGFNSTSLTICFNEYTDPALLTSDRPNEWTNIARDLASVTTIRLEGVPHPSWLETNKCKFNGFSALQNIHLIPCLRSYYSFKIFKSLVYFEHLGKFVMVQFYQNSN